MYRLYSITTRTVARKSLANSYRSFHFSRALNAVKPYLLADIGEGIKECEVIQWFVQPDSRVEEFDKICEVQSDKASVEITSRYNGVIKKLHYEVGDMAIVGKPLLDIDIEGDESESASSPVSEPASDSDSALAQSTGQTGSKTAPASASDHGLVLATPAVRRMCREHKIDIATLVPGSGKDGRIMKEDVTAYLEGAAKQPRQSSFVSDDTTPSVASLSRPAPIQVDTVVPLGPIQAQMFKSMSASLTIPHFLYTDEVCLDSAVVLRSQINAMLKSSPVEGIEKISYLPIFIKAMSLALQKHPLLNAKIDLSGPKPQLVYRAQHNISIAMATDKGLVVPNIKDVANLSIIDIAIELNRLQELSRAGNLAPADLTGGTITLSNIGSIGGTYVGPVIVTDQLAIIGLGRSQKLPRFGKNNEIVSKEILNMSWSADHRVVDGMTMAQMAAEWKSLIENPSTMLMHLK
ncbi:hypothetical protein CANCADRAFT_2169 [Tortispora caseinolytica NRRL Y-17796]|uniref:Dihydrolipoamide acetyltransferase component of pyruvate dehydrogenase complex n=1 Tax=Tortispora caseinolytica NRRL Y-17796 TaxID=767744 RepID=A0A1E4TF91_9ASCO|nr:hypothetical protein CANCADRAFT_2169 [Tortispora caseinolytica NRRL Y-17796]